LAAVITGRRYPESWSENGELVDFYDLKGDLEGVLSLCGDLADFHYETGGHDALHPGQSATLKKGDQLVGYLGALHPEVQKKMGLSQPVFVFQVKLAAITEGKLPSFTELSKYPEVRRDLAIIVDREVAAQAVMNAVQEAAGGELKNLRLFDIYEGKGIDPKRKSIALGLTFQHSSRTLNEDEVNVTVGRVVALLEERFNAALRN
jgi:phenylalanyl-tRNA synthetase beta chain